MNGFRKKWGILTFFFNYLYQELIGDENVYKLQYSNSSSYFRRSGKNFLKTGF
ncbi:hypothetical protein LCGC14_1030080 [marine sediment metagenome]|uniref:Uncharacterized protein n=1 Tax=marine sediment metagenome TaxID=412755 RepID=A0A0F9R0Q4_9ZZZZ